MDENYPVLRIINEFDIFESYLSREHVLKLQQVELGILNGDCSRSDDAMYRFPGHSKQVSKPGLHITLSHNLLFQSNSFAFLRINLQDLIINFLVECHCFSIVKYAEQMSLTKWKNKYGYWLVIISVGCKAASAVAQHPIKQGGFEINY